MDEATQGSYKNFAEVLEAVKEGLLKKLQHIEDNHAEHYYEVDFKSRKFSVYDIKERHWVEMTFGSSIALLYFQAS